MRLAGSHSANLVSAASTRACASRPPQFQRRGVLRSEMGCPKHCGTMAGRDACVSAGVNISAKNNHRASLGTLRFIDGRHRKSASGRDREPLQSVSWSRVNNSRAPLDVRVNPCTMLPGLVRSPSPRSRICSAGVYLEVSLLGRSWATDFTSCANVNGFCKKTLLDTP
jgi:hypothetical protein